MLDEMKRYVGFTPSDEENLRLLQPHVRPLVSAVVDRFYDELFRHQATREVFSGGHEQVARLRATLTEWLAELFDGVYDESYLRKRFRIGVMHVRVQLPQRFMFLGMELVRQELTQHLRSKNLPRIDELLESVHRILTLDLAIMLESYKESYSDQIRRLERTSMEDRLTRAERLAEIGQLAASLAHEIKNPLAGISGAIQVIGEHMSAGDPHRPIVGEILRQINRLDATVKDLLLYARPRPPKLVNVSLGGIVERVLTLMKEEPAMNGRRVEYARPKTEVQVLGDDGQLEQVLLNLLLNAADASPPGRAIHIAIEADTRWSRLTVVDQGKGMSPEILAKANEPFFTTKAKGTGLGLPICQRIVQSHGGMLHLESAVGRGTKVTLELPAGEE